MNSKKATEGAGSGRCGWLNKMNGKQLCRLGGGLFVEYWLMDSLLALSGE